MIWMRLSRLERRGPNVQVLDARRKTQCGRIWQTTRANTNTRSTGAKGTAQIFCNAAETGDAQEDGGKSRAVRNVIRTLIEANGGNGELVKKKIETNRRGVVWFKDERVAEWKVESGGAGKMKLMGEMLRLEDAFNTLMDFKKPE